jgi:hypothetical protein
MAGKKRAIGGMVPSFIYPTKTPAVTAEFQHGDMRRISI